MWETSDMLTSHELFGFMSPPLAVGIIEYSHDHNRELYRTALASVAEARKLRPIFFERTPRTQRHAEMAAALSKPRLELIAANLLRDWLMKKQTAMLIDFLDAMGIPHKDGAIDDLPATVEDAKLQGAIEKLVAKYPPEEVAVYLHAFYTMNQAQWPNLEAILQSDPRLQFGGGNGAFPGESRPPSLGRLLDELSAGHHAFRATCVLSRQGGPEV